MGKIKEASLSSHEAFKNGKDIQSPDIYVVLVVENARVCGKKSCVRILPFFLRNGVKGSAKQYVRCYFGDDATGLQDVMCFAAWCFDAIYNPLRNFDWVHRIATIKKVHFRLFFAAAGGDGGSLWEITKWKSRESIFFPRA